MGTSKLNAKTNKRCVFCEHWDDPARQCVKPVVNNIWEFDSNVKRRCLKTNLEKNAGSYCSHYVCKMPIS